MQHCTAASAAQVPAAVVDDINAAISSLRSALESDNAEEIRAKVDALQKVLMKIGESLSGQAGQAGGEGGAAGGGAAGGAGGAGGAGPGVYDTEEKK